MSRTNKADYLKTRRRYNTRFRANNARNYRNTDYNFEENQAPDDSFDQALNEEPNNEFEYDQNWEWDDSAITDEINTSELTEGRYNWDAITPEEEEFYNLTNALNEEGYINGEITSAINYNALSDAEALQGIQTLGSEMPQEMGYIAELAGSEIAEGLGASTAGTIAEIIGPTVAAIAETAGTIASALGPIGLVVGAVISWVNLAQQLKDPYGEKATQADQDANWFKYVIQDLERDWRKDTDVTIVNKNDKADGKKTIHISDITSPGAKQLLQMGKRKAQDDGMTGGFGFNWETGETHSQRYDNKGRVSTDGGKFTTPGPTIPTPQGDATASGTATTDEVRSGKEGHKSNNIGGIKYVTKTFSKTFKHIIRPNMQEYFARPYHEDNDHKQPGIKPVPTGEDTFNGSTKNQQEYQFGGEPHRYVVWSHDWHNIPAEFPKCAIHLSDLEHWRDAHAYRIVERKVTVHKAQFQTEEASDQDKRKTLGTDNAYLQFYKPHKRFDTIIRNNKMGFDATSTKHSFNKAFTVHNPRSTNDMDLPRMHLIARHVPKNWADGVINGNEPDGMMDLTENGKEQVINWNGKDSMTFKLNGTPTWIPTKYSKAQDAHGFYKNAKVDNGTIIHDDNESVFSQDPNNLKQLKPFNANALTTAGNLIQYDPIKIIQSGTMKDPKDLKLQTWSRDDLAVRMPFKLATAEDIVNEFCEFHATYTYVVQFMYPPERRHFWDTLIHTEVYNHVNQRRLYGEMPQTDNFYFNDSYLTQLNGNLAINDSDESQEQ